VKRARHIGFTLAVVGLWFAAASSARAEPPEQPAVPADAPQATAERDRAQKLYLEGMALYRLEKYGNAIRKFEEAHGLVPSPKLMYNIARCYEASGNLTQAANRYRRVVADPKADYGVQQKARGRLSLVESALERSARAPAESKAAPPTFDAAASKPVSRSGALTVSKWLAGGLAVGLVAAGSVLLTLGLTDEDEIDDARTPEGETSSMTRTRAADLASQGEQRQMVGTILLATGAAAAVASAVLFVFDRTKDERHEQAARGSSHRSALRLGGVPLPHGGALTVAGTF
jgi:tetratricopeptide (TPR) repeat protein